MLDVDRVNMSIQELRGEVLRSVSRSFYLSIRILPQRLRDPVALAYLLARATDTIADTAEVPAQIRAEELRNLASAIQGKVYVDLVVKLRDSFAPLQKNEAERALIESLPACLDWLDKIDNDDRAEVQSVLAKINRGQTLDVERFADASQIRGLQTAAELDEYTYLVAGCVGEFWTRVCFRHLTKFSDCSESEMIELGVRYGKGLQLINILRDAGADLRAGRCYFPNDELITVALRPDEILREPRKFMSILGPWMDKAQNGIEAGMEYSCAIQNRRVRFATVLPALIGARTLSLLRDAGEIAIAKKVKVERREVRAIISSVTLRLASRNALRELFQRLARL
ncbi:MAG: farnesyl-diphosphate farnesyltransferase [Verrucomicrobiota bacterium]|jgi:farnesyl-diphosphate farnesyltransferase